MTGFNTGQFYVTGSGFTPNSPVVVNLYVGSSNNPYVIGSGGSNSAGAININVSTQGLMPLAGAAAGTYTGYISAADTIKPQSNKVKVSLQVIIPPVISPKLTLVRDTQTSSGTNITISGTGFTPGGVVYLVYGGGLGIPVASATADGSGNITITTTSSQIIANSQGQLGAGVGYNVGLIGFDETTAQVSPGITVYIYARS